MKFLAVFWMLVIITFGCFYCSTVRADVAYFDMGTGVLLCHDERGKRISVIEGYEAKSYPEEAYAVWDSELETRLIYISDTITRNRPKSVHAIVAYHECGHHQLQHDLLREDWWWSTSVLREEQEADCFSSLKFFENHGPEAHEQMLIDMKESKMMNMRRYERFKNCIK